jgi:hypothetical protein
MKKVSFNKIVTSLVLMALVATTLFMSVGITPILTIVALLAIGMAKGLISPSTEMPKNLAYDGFVISDTTYAGEVASQFIVKSITDNETVNGGHIYVKDGIKKKFTIPRFDMDFEDLIQDRQATPTSAGEMTVDGKTIEPQDYMIYMEFNPRDFEDHWYATQLQPALIDRALPATVESVVVQEALKRHAKYLNRAIWNSDTTTTGKYKYFNGLRKKATLSGATLSVTSPVVLTTSNIIAEMQRGYDRIPDALKYDPSMKFFMSYATYDLYMQAQIAQTYKGVDTTNQGVPTFRGLSVVKIEGLPANFYFIAKGAANMESNLWFGLNSTSDENNIKLAQLQANSELYFIKILMKADVQIGWNEETVYYQG